MKFEINTLQVECFEDRPMVYSPNHPFPRYIYIYRMLVSTCPMSSSSWHIHDVMILLFVTDDDDNDEAPGTAAAFIGAGIFGQHMTSLGPKAPYFLSNALLVEFLGAKGDMTFVV